VLVVIDANVFVSAAIQRGASHRIIESWLGGSAEFEVVMCPELLGEIREVLTTRPRLRKWISLENATLFVDTIEAVVDLVNDPDEIQTETRDPNDDYLIALARAHDVAASHEDRRADDSDGSAAPTVASRGRLRCRSPSETTQEVRRQFD